MENKYFINHHELDKRVLLRFKVLSEYTELFFYCLAINFAFVKLIRLFCNFENGIYTINVIISPNIKETTSTPTNWTKISITEKYRLYVRLPIHWLKNVKWIKYVQNEILAIKLNNFVSIVSMTNEFLQPSKDGKTVNASAITKKSLADDW